MKKLTVKFCINKFIERSERVWL